MGTMPPVSWPEPREIKALRQALGDSVEDFAAVISAAVLRTPFIAYTHKEIRRIRIALGKSNAEFAEIFRLSEDEIKAWQTPITSKKHRDPSPPACIILFWCATVANTSVSCRNNLIRAAAELGKDWLADN
ncbi:MAG: DUF1456 family protein [Desulfobulbaceae bacterium]|nr:DUF1456 family protein [Desulfobulbaceae bacterium]